MYIKDIKPRRNSRKPSQCWMCKDHQYVLAVVSMSHLSPLSGTVTLHHCYNTTTARRKRQYSEGSSNRINCDVPKVDSIHLHLILTDKIRVLTERTVKTHKGVAQTLNFSGNYVFLNSNL
ncbi:hypothetical protein J6590_099076, partial [Homalodisca vitripennis]